jgi:hypothetical protein
MRRVNVIKEKLYFGERRRGRSSGIKKEVREEFKSMKWKFDIEKSGKQIELQPQLSGWEGKPKSQSQRKPGSHAMMADWQS